jgi:DNA mismatch endonuclease Vsr
MAAIGGKNTQPEMLVRRLAHSLGYRYRLHVKNLPGRPDIVFPAYRKIIEVRGCFWHRHPGCVLAATPATRVDFWEEKFRATVARDIRNVAALQARGWAVMVLWECETSETSLRDRLFAFLGPSVNRLATNAR